MKGFCLWNIVTTLVVGVATTVLSPIFDCGLGTATLAAVSGVGVMFMAMLMVLEESIDLDFGDVILIIGAAGIGGTLLSPLILVEIYWIFSVAFIGCLLLCGRLHANDRHASPWWTMLHLVLNLAGVDGCRMAVEHQRPGIGIAIILASGCAMAAIMRFALAPPERPCIGGLPDSA